MRIEKWINIDQEIEIELSSEDILLTFDNDAESLPSVLRGLNDVATFLKGVSDSKIIEMSSGQRKIIMDFLLTEAKRYPEDA